MNSDESPCLHEYIIIGDVSWWTFLESHIMLRLPANHDNSRFNLFYYLIKSLLLGMR